MPETGAICIWNGITAEGRDDFYDWHVHEHMPERVGIPGFLRGRRFVALTAETTPEFFTLYETADPDVMTSTAYLARLNAPTEWTLRATAHFRATSRALTRVACKAGAGSGGVIATLRYFETAAGEQALQAFRDDSTGRLARLCSMPRVACARLCLTNSDASRAKTTESRHRKDVGDAPIAALLIEGCDLPAVRAAIATLGQGSPLAPQSEGIAIGYYGFEFGLP